MPNDVSDDVDLIEAAREMTRECIKLDLPQLADFIEEMATEITRLRAEAKAMRESGFAAAVEAAAKVADSAGDYWRTNRTALSGASWDEATARAVESDLIAKGIRALAQGGGNEQ